MAVWQLLHPHGWAPGGSRLPARARHTLGGCTRADAGCSRQARRRVVVADQYRRPRTDPEVSAPAPGQQPSSGPPAPQSRAKKW